MCCARGNNPTRHFSSGAAPGRGGRLRYSFRDVSFKYNLWQRNVLGVFFAPNSTIGHLGSTAQTWQVVARSRYPRLPTSFIFPGAFTWWAGLRRCARLLTSTPCAPAAAAWCSEELFFLSRHHVRDNAGRADNPTAGPDSGRLLHWRLACVDSSSTASAGSTAWCACITRARSLSPQGHGMAMSNAPTSALYTTTDAHITRAWHGRCTT